MLGSLELKNYRAFDSFSMKGLARVNLLVGKNNCGKTSLLEAVHFLVSGGSAGVMKSIATRRGEGLLTSDGQSGLEDVSCWFFGFDPKLEDVFSIWDPQTGVSVTTRATVPSERDTVGRSAQQPRVRKILTRAVAAPESSSVEWTAWFGLGPGAGLDLARYWTEEAAEMENPSIPRSISFLSPESSNPRALAEAWTMVQGTGREDEVLASLHIIERNIDSVNFLAGRRTGLPPLGRIGVVASFQNLDASAPKGEPSREAQKGLTSLGSLGAGVWRLLELGCALVSAKDGYLLIDEIDTGLHYSVMADMWRLVVKTAARSNMQVFATTHSWDCVEGLSRLCAEEAELIPEVAIHTIEPSLKRAVTYSGESVARMARSQVDPR